MHGHAGVDTGAHATVRLGESGRDQCVQSNDDTQQSQPAEQSIHRLFEAQARARPQETAIVCGTQCLTYAGLNAKANQLAHALIELGVKPDDRIGLYAPRSLESVVGMLAILKAGGAYVPLDPSYPERRLRFMRDDSSLTAMLTTSSLLPQAAGLDCRALALDTELQHATNDPHVTGHTVCNLAYVIYTSGSTGQPKGVLVEHRNVLSLIVQNDYASIGPHDCLTHTASPAFDATTWEVWAALLNGARLVVVPHAVVVDPSSFNRLLIEQRVTALWLTVGLFHQYADVLEEAFSGLRLVLTGGDTLVPSIIARVLGKRRRPRQLINCYGPTETTTFATTHVIAGVADGATAIPIGRPIPGAQVHILDEDLQPVAAGAAGEICIGGAGVGRGYLNQAALTRERFIPDQFSAEPGARLYRTGDLGRWRADGNVEFLGRNDFQIKLRGFRVELGEVESAMQRCAGVRQAIAVVREESGNKRLLGYIVPAASLAESADVARLVDQVREQMKAELPPHMVPAVIVALKCLPLMVNGKVDRNALPAPEAAQQLRQQSAPAVTPTEEALSAVWRSCLKTERVGAEDNFYDLGGDSVLGIDMIAKAADVLQIELPFTAVLEYPTVRQLAQFVDRLRVERAVVTKPVGVGILEGSN